MQELWLAEATKYNGLPLSDLGVFEMMGRWRPSLAGGAGRSTASIAE